MNRARAAVACLVSYFIPMLGFASDMSSRIVTCDGTSVGGGTACTICELANTAQHVVNTGIYMVVFLSSVLFAYAGWVYLMAGGDTGAAAKAKSIFTNVAIGLVIVLSAWLVVDTIIRALFNQGAGFGPWNKIC